MSNPGQVLRNGLREAGIVLAIWLATLIWTITASYWFGTDRGTEEVATILGMPRWVVIGILLPWAASTIATIVFCVRIMKDDDLGQEQEAGHG